MTSTSLQSARFGGDRDLLQRITSDDVMRREFHRTEVLRRQSVIRARLLGEAARLNVRLLPHVAESFARLSQSLAGDKPLEAYVFAEPGINAFVAEGTRHLLVGISSGAIRSLSSKELDFVIGHELGHACYGHLDVPARFVLETSPLDGERCQLLRAWQRAAEVSADRAGLVSCGSLEVAATAMFKTISGLDTPGLTVAPAELAQQWGQLVEEMLDDGRRDQWQLSHPPLPLRMQALMTFWQAGPGTSADNDVRRLLALMDASAPAGAQAEDPYLARFVFWGGAYVALAEGAPSPAQKRRLQELAPAGIPIESALVGDDSASDAALSRFQEAQRTRRSKLSATELHRITSGLVGMAAEAGRVTQRELERLHRLGRELNLTSQAMDLLVSKRAGKG